MVYICNADNERICSVYNVKAWLVGWWWGFSQARGFTF